MPLVIDIEDEDLHRSHFYVRELETEGSRPFKRYRANFHNIRKIGRYISSLAEESNVSVINSTSLDETVFVIVEHILNQVIAEKKKQKSELTTVTPTTGR